MFRTKLTALTLAGLVALGTTGMTAFASDIETVPTEPEVVESQLTETSPDTTTDETTDTTSETTADETTEDAGGTQAPIQTPETPVAPEVPGRDPSDWAKGDVLAAIGAGIVPGTLQDGYQTTTTRAEFCALAVGFYETITGEEIVERMSFSDTDDVNVEKMAGLGVVNGMGDGTFDPDGTLSREQAATILARLAEVVGMPLDMADPIFSDIDRASDWALDAIGQVQAAEIMTGMGDNRFAPQGEYSREQSIITVLRLFRLVSPQV